jgi:hypothetical protein
LGYLDQPNDLETLGAAVIVHRTHEDQISGALQVMVVIV